MIPAAETKLYDLGVADFDRDGRLDVYTINHTFPATVLRNRPAGRGWRESSAQLGLAPTPAFPGWEDQLASPPAIEGAGLYAYIQKEFGGNQPNRIHLGAEGVTVSGRLVLDPRRPHRPPSASGGTIAESRGPAEELFYDFVLEPGGEAIIRAYMLDLPLRIETDLAGSNKLFVGANAIPAPGPTVELAYRDRHGFALADANRDGFEDLYEVVGGLSGRIAEFPWRGRLADHAYAGLPGPRFLHAATLDKDDCRGRDAAALDINADGLTDYFTSCAEADAVAYLRRPPPKGFAREVIPNSGGDIYRWIQADGDRRPELVVARETIKILERRAAGWNVVFESGPIQLPGKGRPPVSGSKVEQVVAQSISVADHNDDGRADLFVTTTQGNALLEADAEGSFLLVDPASRGLPSKSLTAAWVDYNNDGALDLHALPQGLYKRAGNEWDRTSRLDWRRAGNALVSWADFDNDGRRDPLLALAASQFAPRHDVSLLRNRGPARDWLAIDTPGAQEASAITVRAGSLLRYGWTGQADESRHSQTHNRTYFTFGNLNKRSAEGLAKVTVRWTTGGRTRLDVPLNAVVRLEP